MVYKIISPWLKCDIYIQTGENSALSWFIHVYPPKSIGREAPELCPPRLLPAQKTNQLGMAKKKKRAA